MPAERETRYGQIPSMYEDAGPRTDWPEPPVTAAEPTAPGAPSAQRQAEWQSFPLRNETSTSGDPGPSYGRMLVGMAVSAALPALAALLMRRRGAVRSPGPRCPECDGTRIRTHAVPAGTKTYVRRMGRGNTISEIQVERVVRTCPCGYSSEGALSGSRLEDVLVLRMDQRLGG